MKPSTKSMTMAVALAAVLSVVAARPCAADVPDPTPTDLGVLADRASAVYDASDGGEAIAVCAAERPDWVLIDLRMKPVDGLRATAAIKARWPETRVVIVTQYDDAELRAEALRAGACAYVLKENLHELPAILTGVTLETMAARSTTAPGHPRPNRDGPSSTTSK